MYSVKNKDGSFEVRVTKISLGYSVTVKDLDAGEVLPFATIFDDFDKAKSKADSIAAEQPMTGGTVCFHVL